jgi:hypothetical protein
MDTCKYRPDTGCCTHDDFDVYLCPLHAAAPALLEALEAAVQCMERMPTSWGAAFECDKARAAIAQAKGQA